MILREGDRIPADSEILVTNNLSVDESLLTGESLPVKKYAGTGSDSKVYSGTLITEGHALVRAVLTGSDTRMGKIGRSLENIKEEDTLIKKETGVIVKKFAAFGLGLCFLIFIIYGFSRGNWLEGNLPRR